MLNKVRILFPLKIRTITHGSYDYSIISPYQAEAYIDEVLEAVTEENKDFENDRGLAEYIEDEAIKAKVYSLYPTVEVIDEELWGVMIAKLNEVLSEEETIELLNYVSGQNSDGYGEGFEQKSIDTPDGKIYVSFWNNSDNYAHKAELM